MSPSHIQEATGSHEPAEWPKLWLCGLRYGWQQKTTREQSLS